MSNENPEMSSELFGDNVKGYVPLNLDECMNVGGLANDDYETDKVLGDIVKVEYIDQNEQGEVNRGGIFVKQEMGTRLWRVGRVIKRGSQAAKELQEGVLVRFPSDRGIPCVADGKKYVYLNAERIFEVVKIKTSANKYLKPKE